MSSPDATPLPRAEASDSAAPAEPTFDLAGRVVDERDEPVPSFYVVAATLDAAPEPARSTYSSVTDVDGAFVLHGLTRGEWSVKALGVSHADSRSVRARIPAELPVRLVMTRLMRVSGRVLDAGGAPVAGALVGDGVELGNRTATDRRGAFVLEGLKPGSITLIAGREGACPSRPLLLELAPGEAVADVVLRLRAGGRIEGQITAPNERRSFWTIFATLERELFEGGTLADADGRFELTELPPGEVELRAFAPGAPALRAHATVREGETTPVRLQHAEAAKVRLQGRIVIGEPRGRIWVHVKWDDGQLLSTTADESGEYELELPSPGAYQLSLGVAGFSWSRPIAVPEVREFRHDVTLELGSVAGRVVDEHGQPVAGMQVKIDGGNNWVRSDRDGNYELTVPAGEHALTVLSWKHSDGWNLTAPRVPIAVAAGERRTGVELVLRATGLLEGRVRCADSAPAGKAAIWAFEDAGPRRLAETQADGTFQVTGLEPGTHWIGATRSGYGTERVSVEIEPDRMRRILLTLLE